MAIIRYIGFSWALMCLFLAGVLLLCSPAQAQQTIFNIPSADVAEPKSVFFSHASVTRPYAPNAFWVGTSYAGIGIGRKTELNVTLYNLSSPPANASIGLGKKTAVSILEERFPDQEFKCTTGGQLLVSLDGQGLGKWGYSHISGRIPKLKTRLTGGVSAGDEVLLGRNTIHFIGGIEQPLTKNLSIGADWFSGTHALGVFTPGLSYAIPRFATSLYLGYQIPNNIRVGKPGVYLGFAKAF